MSGKNTAVFGIYHTREAAEEAVDALRNAHFRNTDISALFPDNAGTKDFAHEKNTKAPEGATTGAASGASNSITPATVPGTPTIGTATQGNAQASVAFTAPSSNGGGTGGNAAWSTSRASPACPWWHSRSAWWPRSAMPPIAPFWP